MSNNNLIKLRKRQKQEKKDKKTKSDRKINYFRNWRKKHPNYFKKYYKKNAKSIIENSKRYLQSAKGKETSLRYEHSEKRMIAKREWQRNHRSKS